MGLKVNDRVVVGSKLGTLRFCGTTEFSTGPNSLRPLTFQQTTIHAILDMSSQFNQGSGPVWNWTMQRGRTTER